jgi:DNA-binding CsgD family transcriptional regulator
MECLAPELVRLVVDELPVPLVVIASGRLVYMNQAADRLSLRMKAEHATELPVVVQDHLASIAAYLSSPQVVSLVTAGNGEPFYVNVRRVQREGVTELALVTVRELVPDREAFRGRYGLTEREAQVVDLVLRGCGNRDVARVLGIAPATAKKHLTSIFDKTGVDSRTQLISRLL